MRKILILFVLLGTLLLFGCQSEQAESEPEIGPREKLAEQLDIYIVSDAVHRIYQSEEREDMYYTTFMTLGDFSHIPTTYGYEGFLYAQAFEDYQEETGTNLNITWFEYEEYMKEALLAEETEKPDLILSSGAAVAVPFFYLGKLFGMKTIYIEVFDRIDRPTLTGRLVYPIADKFIVQWEEMTKIYPKAECLGSIF